MKIIAFNFTKVLAEKSRDFKLGSKIGTNINFLNIEKEESSFAQGESEVLRASFNFSVKYGDGEKNEKEAKGSEISLTGFVLLTTTKEESALLLDSWSKKKLSASFKVPLFNFILKKCSVRALQLEEEIGIPLHLPLPQIGASDKEEKKK